MRCAIFALLIALLSPLSALSNATNATKTGVTFVSSDEELNFALVIFDRDQIDSLAVSQTFYLGTAKQTKDRIRGLIAGMQNKVGKGIYVYGQSLDRILGAEILGQGGALCSPLSVLGKFHRNSSTAYACDGTSRTENEEQLRQRVFKLDKDVRE